MRLWLARNSTVPIREQLVTQVVLGILCNELVPGERLPSTRELARRFHVHSNTISAAYRQLEQDRWVESVRGSGVYVRTPPAEQPPPSHLALDQMIATLFRSARELGTPLSALRSRLHHWLDLQPPDHFLVIEPDEHLREIVMTEMRRVLIFPVTGCGFDECSRTGTLLGAIPVVLPSKLASVRKILPAETDCLVLQVNSVPTSLAPWLPAPSDSLVAVVSRWAAFLKSARTMLSAAGFDVEALVLRNAGKAGWRRGLNQFEAVICDTAIAAELGPLRPPVIVFPLLSPSSLAELKRYESFVSETTSSSL